MLRHIPCFLGFHRPDKARVRHDGSDFVAPCRGCGRRMIKTRSARREWALDDPETRRTGLAPRYRRRIGRAARRPDAI